MDDHSEKKAALNSKGSSETQKNERQGIYAVINGWPICRKGRKSKKYGKGITISKLLQERAGNPLTLCIFLRLSTILQTEHFSGWKQLLLLPSHAEPLVSIVGGAQLHSFRSALFA